MISVRNADPRACHDVRSRIMKMTCVLSAVLAGMWFAGSLAPAAAQQSVRVGELNSYKAQPAFLDPYKKGIDLAIEVDCSGIGIEACLLLERGPFYMDRPCVGGEE